MKTRNIRTVEGAELGRMMASYCDEAEPKARLRFTVTLKDLENATLERGSQA
jgi:hypothetical protein